MQALRTQPAGTDIHEVRRTQVDDWTALDRAPTVIGVGDGVDRSELDEVHTLARSLNAEVAATRRAVDKGLFPRSRQVGLTGRSIAPRLYIAVGLSGRPNHFIGVGRAQTIVFINIDTDAPGFDTADVGIVGDWRRILPLLVTGLSSKQPATPDVVARQYMASN